MSKTTCHAENGARPAKTALGALAVATILILCLLLLPAASAAYTWTSLGSPQPPSGITAMAFDDAHGVLYTACGDSQVYKYESGTWSSTGFSVMRNLQAMTYDTVLDTLFVAAFNYNTNAAEVYALHDGSWSQLGSALGTGFGPIAIISYGAGGWVYCGGGDGNVYACNINDPAWFVIGTGMPANGTIDCLAYDSANDIIYAGSRDLGAALGCVYRCVGGTWELYGTFPNSRYVRSLQFDPSRNVLYAGLETGTNGIPNVYRRNIQQGGSWVTIGTLCGGPVLNALEIDVANDFLFAGPYDGRVYKNALASAGSTWVDMGLLGSDVYPVRYMAYSPSTATVYASPSTAITYKTSIPRLTSISPSSGRLGQTLDVELTATDGQFTSASQAIFSGDGVKVNSTSRLSANKVRANVTINPETYTGPRNVWVKTGGDQTTRLFDGFTVTPLPASTTWYLAEGTNAWGFNTYVSITNPNAEDQQAKITWMDQSAGNAGKGIITSRTINLPALSQTTVSSSEIIGAVDFSTKVECLGGDPIAVDRTMFWTGEGQSAPGYHSSIGANTPAGTWYLPEGSSAWGFETWTLVENPNPVDANVTLTYMKADGPASVDKVIPANSRATYSMAADIGAADASIKVASDQPVVAERSMYRDGRREGSCSIGANLPANDFFLAEGAVGYDSGFTTYVLVQNPNGSENDVTLTYQTGSGRVKGPSFTMKPNSRQTVRLNDTLPANTDVSTQVHGSKPLIAERAMYWDSGQAFHASIGLSSPEMFFMLPDGQTDKGFETWTLVENPNPGAVRVNVVYLPQGGGEQVGFTDEIPANSRKSYNMADKIPSGRASILVESQDGARPVMVERSMYMDGRSAGTCTVGGYLTPN
jgi:hypothetical protein